MTAVLYPLRYYPTLTETFILGEIGGMQAAGERPIIAAMGARADGALQTELPNAPVWRVPRRPLAGRLTPHTAGMRWLAEHQRPKDVARLPWLTRRVRAAALSHAHVHFAGEAAEWALALKLDTGLPYSVMVHAVDLFKPRPSLLQVLGGASKVMAVADHHVRRLADLGVPAVRVRCGPDLTRFAPSPLPPGPMRAVFIGRCVPKKGLDLLLDAWEAGAPPDATLQVISDRLPRPAPANVEMRGLLAPPGVRAILTASNLMVLPCREAPDGDMDGVPVVMMEAMAMGRPVIGGAVSGVPELINEDVGWLHTPDDMRALLDAIRQANSPIERQQRGSKCPQRLISRGFSLQQQVAATRCAWHNLA